jgi:hypothetical protein
MVIALLEGFRTIERHNDLTQDQTRLNEREITVVFSPQANSTD